MTITLQFCVLSKKIFLKGLQIADESLALYAIQIKPHLVKKILKILNLEGGGCKHLGAVLDKIGAK